ncbi:hypothetical protein TPHA_0C01700 [Tetrapisispora phaffii CBS 4417]|uniref:SAGA-associated factor 11 n=1 Tax=Tetrapisispora phaffii (strain ATCC 24235 / CBS 4417 / NBRC 1672 / NRRL Y-8282 / UCD 70-5) TaxID=1071381 RepID=G8BRF0_TETPH|nr:hypothetical protein TPHA_0C01700 [Tetrapisispora phaffii CBS 4417]CCE62326.1 hypothetical protein TPHA_0C01700 [Tetrapisispora phaffii CBS 4417]
MSATINSVSKEIYNNIITTVIQDIVSREVVEQKQIKSRHPDYKPYHYDSTGTLDILGVPKIQESSQYFHCNNCDRDVSANRFAAHLQRCLNSRSRN